MRNISKLVIAAACFFAALTMSNVSNAQVWQPHFITSSLYYEVGLEQSVGDINYEVYTAGYYLISKTFDDQTGTVRIVEESYHEQEVGVYLWGLRVFGMSVGYVEVTLTLVYEDSNGERYTITATLRCTVFVIDFWGRMMPTVSPDANQLPSLSTDTHRLPAILPQKD